MNMSHIVKATELKLFAKFRLPSSFDRNILDKLWPKVCLLLIQVAQDSQEDQEGELNFAPSVVVEVCPLRIA